MNGDETSDGPGGEARDGADEGTSCRRDYLLHLYSLLEKAESDYDRNVLALSGAALGVSFAFLKVLLGPGPFLVPLWLALAWSAWGLSILCVLASFFFSQQALRSAIREFDADSLAANLGGRFDRITACFNVLSGGLFLVGVILMAIFVFHNVGGNHETSGNQQEHQITASTSTLSEAGPAAPRAEPDSSAGTH
jgi:hypothetical protein